MAPGEFRAKPIRTVRLWLVPSVYCRLMLGEIVPGWSVAVQGQSSVRVRGPCPPGKGRRCCILPGPCPGRLARVEKTKWLSLCKTVRPARENESHGQAWADHPVPGAVWQPVGTWARLVTHLLDHLERHGQLGHRLWCVDATCFRALPLQSGWSTERGFLRGVSVKRENKHWERSLFLPC
jgi:hypothetical protein